MNSAGIYAILVVAAALEAGGDALVRKALRSQQGLGSLALFMAGAVVLFGYGVLVNAPPWNFGRLLGVYVTLFFLIAQLMNLFLFGVQPSLSILVGGALIVAGGIVMTVWQA